MPIVAGTRLGPYDIVAPIGSGCMGEVYRARDTRLNRDNIRIPSDVSPDGKQLLYYSIGERQEDAFIGPFDGGRIRRLTDDAGGDRAPVFTRDGKSVVFYSNRGGNWSVWVVRTDGSGTAPGDRDGEGLCLSAAIADRRLLDLFRLARLGVVSHRSLRPRAGVASGCPDAGRRLQRDRLFAGRQAPRGLRDNGGRPHGCRRYLRPPVACLPS